ncbi:MAG: ATP-binding cassette, subfamily bacterial [Gaiellaceae bacterium]|jgi:ATP-binding cassette subfamily B protein|nr:ATP-binding cassette, subfamily bacterial [Gaiellaceae bacterium]
MRDFLAGFGAILRSGWRASPRRLLGLAALNLLQYLSWPLAPVALKYVTDAVVERDVRTATIAAAFLPVLALLNQVAGHVAHVLWVEVSDLNVAQVNSELGALSQGSRGLEHHERPDFADRIELLRTAGNPLYMSVRTAVDSIGRAIQLVVTVVMLALLEPLLLLLLAFAIPPLVASRWAFRRFLAAVWGDLERSRRATHLLDLAIRADAAKEIRVFGLERELRTRLRDSREDLRRRRFKAETTGVAVMSVGQLVFALGYVFGLLFVVRGAIDGEHTAGDVVLAFTLAAQTNALVYEIVGTTMFLQRGAEAMRRLTWLRRLVAHLYPPDSAVADVPSRLDGTVRFEGVSFRYPGTDADVLTDVDLEVPAGSTIAFVGENGAGKSTLVKLLCRFYEPTSGRILIDGVDLSTLPAAAWREQIAAGFQDFVRFELVAQESIGVGDLPLVADRDAVAAAVERAAAADVVERLPDGLETQLGKTHTDGAELSGGQWQKVALARAMMRERPLLLILDEPTSALDAHAEHELFERYAESARAVARATGAIAVFVSHRFSTVRMADLIVVVAEGRVVERGSHEELVARGGVYAELFALQAAAYG